jgi:hypothetical protein
MCRRGPGPPGPACGVWEEARGRNCSYGSSVVQKNLDAEWIPGLFQRFFSVENISSLPTPRTHIQRTQWGVFQGFCGRQVQDVARRHHTHGGRGLHRRRRGILDRSAGMAALRHRRMSVLRVWRCRRELAARVTADLRSLGGAAGQLQRGGSLGGA